jgi:NADH dehydrogenase [ubiquinone] 1 alpha subcomplex assembly factor 6
MPLPYLAEELRRADYDLYLLTLFVKADRRPFLWALFLFHTEIARTRDVVSDTTLGLIRLQWWRDEFDKIYSGGDGGQNPILSTLAEAVRRYDLSRADFDTLLYAREFDLEDVSPANLDGLRHYADFTTTPLFRLALKIAGEGEAESVLQFIAIEYAVINIARSVPYFLKRRRNLLPLDSLVAQKLDGKNLFNIKDKRVFLNVIKGLFSDGKRDVKPASRFLKRVSKISSIYLRQLQKNNFDVFLPIFQQNPPFFALRLIVI